MAPVFVALLYLAIQMLEGYLLTLLVQSRVEDIPPVVTLVAQVLLDLLLGAPGIVLATPLAAAALVLVKKLNVGDVLGDFG
jgi:predicted PurR-regulated permease PerM